MPSDFAFRLATHLALALACVCLGYAEWDLLKEGSILAGLVVVLLGVSLWAEGRYVLDLGAANRVGFAIGVVAVVWLGYQFLNRNSLIYTFPWPASLLPYLGPVLMVLMPAKLFRPKHVGDWWAMQGIALAGAGLAASMAEDELFGVLLALYVIAAVSSLTLFFLRRSAGRIAPIPNTIPSPAPVVYAAPGVGGRRLILRASGWLAVAVGLAFPFFLITPRSAAPRWQFGSSRIEVGYASDELVDLNRTGDLKENRELAVLVTARHPDGRPKEDLNPAQRWRGAAYSRYLNGQWSRAVVPGLMNLAGDGAVYPGNQTAPPPDFGPNAYFLSFQPQANVTDPVLADPVRWVPGQPVPIITEGGGYRPWAQRVDGSFQGFPPQPGVRFQYRQAAVLAAEGEEDRGTPFGLTAGAADPGEHFRTVPGQLRQLSRWADDLLVRLAAAGRLPAGVLDRMNREQRRVAPADYEAVARAFCDYFRTSGEFEYTLKLRKGDKTADPIEDFLLRTKAGHCERFAAALTLAVRAVGVPAQYVLGFKGCEPDGTGQYSVRQDHAHAWVEVLVPHGPSTRPDGTPTRWQWVSLDPTPDGSDAAEGTTWFTAARETWANLFFEFIVGYNRERRRAFAAAQWWATANRWYLGAAAGLVLLTAVGRAVQRARRVGPMTGLTTQRQSWLARFLRPTALPPADNAADVSRWYDELLAVLARHGHRVPPGTTPREFAAGVAKALAGDGSETAAAEAPVRMAAVLYRTRYAGQAPAPADLEQLTADLRSLTAALARPR
ncbi:MAG: transglutaminase domain-containing protein [Gemmataceae bacterium]